MADWWFKAAAKRAEGGVGGYTHGMVIFMGLLVDLTNELTS